MPRGKNSKKELEIIRLRIISIYKSDPDLQRKIVAERVGCSNNHVLRVLKDADLISQKGHRWRKTTG